MVVEHGRKKKTELAFSATPESGEVGKLFLRATSVGPSKRGIGQ